MSDTVRKNLVFIGNRHPLDRFVPLEGARTFQIHGQLVTVQNRPHFHRTGFVGYCGLCLRYV